MSPLINVHIGPLTRKLELYFYTNYYRIEENNKTN